MHYDYKTQGTCSRTISFDIEDGTVKNVKFEGGCNGNLKGISALAEGKKPEELIKCLEGIKCGFKQTSCPDQLSRALKSALEEK
ncbi:MAG: TIGR03905 family TSCPD domain-containing protein [Oscillospiraceae bacterium]|mgnify:CR=1 FL=1|nr:TIGR03905 family TSCPD domain-containing protein [Oscillospiraceae bacterium]MDD7470466.1 TIGR03905 family TSCPD domain-containing protein [Oscillospiraceae bacterium]MDO4397347.1 TIGR03905 family TSCPD domain-containing protein [Oscillospiraceae bacterium]MDY2678790.1 TIGR03905 family TSCPD domain-containing protein [Oscillospiraceae bacterium]